MKLLFMVVADAAVFRCVWKRDGGRDGGSEVAAARREISGEQ